MKHPDKSYVGRAWRASRDEPWPPMPLWKFRNIDEHRKLWHRWLKEKPP